MKISRAAFRKPTSNPNALGSNSRQPVELWNPVVMVSSSIKTEICYIFCIHTTPSNRTI